MFLLHYLRCFPVLPSLFLLLPQQVLLPYEAALPLPLPLLHELLAEWKIPLVAEDVGNNYGRTIEFDPATGELMIRTIGVGDTVI